jgi:hypothetical protein
MINYLRNLVIKKSIYTLIFILTIGCDSIPKDWEWGIRPRPLNGLDGFPSAKTEYGAGFKEGCGFGWSTVNKGLMSDFTPMTMDTKKITKSSDYRAGWWDGFEQCVYTSDWDVI